MTRNKDEQSNFSSSPNADRRMILAGMASRILFECAREAGYADGITDWNIDLGDIVLEYEKRLAAPAATLPEGWWTDGDGIARKGKRHRGAVVEIDSDGDVHFFDGGPEVYIPLAVIDFLRARGAP